MSLPKRINAKVIVAGPAATGKTCLIERFVNNVFAADDATHGPTLGCDCLQKSVFIEDTEVHLFLYDTAGQERFADMAASYYRVAEVCLLCFDMSDVSTFDRTQFWMKRVTDHNPKCLFILVGTKEDLLTQEQSGSMEPISHWAEEAGIPFFPTSALKGGEHIRFLFHTVAEKCIRLKLKYESQTKEGTNGIKLASSIGQPKAGCCT
ncbi:rab24 [Symbiodinium sp. CCMP2592]|nr:rab24 [Symbiodinium sp. CCMP2592]|mmetsp:Transcript_28120/g.66065  ORF Transcript_28120/g.66065 Transcript_28120/m.66065 type:complete len:207 (-) Transcript_28120:74-694(-)